MQPKSAILCGKILVFVMQELSRLVYEYLPYASTKTAIKVKFVKPVKTAIGIKSVLGYGQQTNTEP